MILRHRVALDGVELDSLDQRILVTKVEEAAGKETYTGVNVWTAGQRITADRRDTLDVVVRFAIMLRAGEMAERAAVFDKIVAWSHGLHSLSVNYRPGRILRVRCTQLPAMGSPADWANDFSITFRAYEVPFWQDAAETRINLGKVTSATQSINLACTERTPLCLYVTNSSGSVNGTLTISANGNSITFTDMNIAAGQKFSFGYNDGIQYAKRGSESILGSRQSTSADDIWLNPGANTISYSATRRMDVVVGYTGRWV